MLKASLFMDFYLICFYKISLLQWITQLEQKSPKHLPIPNSMCLSELLITLEWPFWSCDTSFIYLSVTTYALEKNFEKVINRNNLVLYYLWLLIYLFFLYYEYRKFPILFPNIILFVSFLNVVILHTYTCPDTF